MCVCVCVGARARAGVIGSSISSNLIKLRVCLANTPLCFSLSFKLDSILIFSQTSP